VYERDLRDLDYLTNGNCIFLPTALVITLSPNYSFTVAKATFPFLHSARPVLRCIIKRDMRRILRRLGWQTWPADLAGRLGRQTWPADLVGRLGRQIWPADLAGRLGRQTWPADLAGRLDRQTRLSDLLKLKMA
jgi:hypothetical protein